MFKRSLLGCALFSFLASAFMGSPANALGEVPAPVATVSEGASSARPLDDEQDPESNGTFHACYKDNDECLAAGREGLIKGTWRAFVCLNREGCAPKAALYVVKRYSGSEESTGVVVLGSE